jgi:hypothetical protein
MSDADRIFKLLGKAKKLAQHYRQLTGKPLGIAGEVAEFEAARILGVTLTPARQGGYDALERKKRRVRKLQIKGRCSSTPRGIKCWARSKSQRISTQC